MLQGLLTRQTQVTTHQDREAQRFLSLLDETNDVGQYLAVKTLRIRLLGEFVLLANDMPISGLDVPRLRSLLAYLACIAACHNRARASPSPSGPIRPMPRHIPTCATCSSSCA